MFQNFFTILPGRAFLLAAILALSALVPDTLHAAERIALQASDGTYIRAGVTKNTLLATGSPHIKGWETFTLIRLSDGKIALRSEQNGKYVRAGVGQNSLLAAVSSRIGGWEQFEFVGSGNTVALKSVQSGKCVRATEQGYLSATARECIDAEPKLSIVLLP
ncbi:fascin domain-containing protein [Dichotomicrobium thermohalophilum]|uniref:FRG1-like protein n=1 Tax=Dichotomicrobium thermohalophilum TaxID=933063 RepID=A0A397Q5S8_9HYPH|nr:hypothetical protein [Dichotomicrobium thermohalophilum]RIA55809.1 FRG1-like protein [Dichotomicrobium thermohalophilum]